MIATCPACATRYVVDPVALGAAGRAVRCARCRNTWHLTPPEDALIAATMGEVQRPKRYIPGMEDPPAASQAEETPTGPPPETSVERAAAASQRAQRHNLPAVRRPVGRPMLMAWGALAGALVIFLGIVIGLRGPISRSIPALAGVYGALGLAPDEPAARTPKPRTAADALAFVSLALKLESEGGVPVLTVTGQIRNDTDQGFDLPPVTATLLDGGKRKLYSWDFDPPATHIGPRQSLAFSSRLSNPPAQVREAVLTFPSGRPGGR
jgi:predicted Zn finger-like uncharacterized protein